MKVYIAGPLFNDMERNRNDEIAKLVESYGFSTYLPQRDGGVYSEMLTSGKPLKEIRQNIFTEDIEALKTSDIVLCLLDGRTPDEGMCIEVGMAYILNKKCIAYRTDSRISEFGGMNIILEGVLSAIVKNPEELQNYFSNLN